MMTDRPFLVAVGGPTASGKSSLAMALASLLPVQIVNFDSMQVYRGMDIGTAKASAREQEKVPHHLIDLCDPDEPFSAGRYIRLFRRTIDEITGREYLPVAVGGTGLYLRGALGGLFDGPERDDGLREELRALETAEPGMLYRLLEEKDPETACKTMPNDTVRIIRALEVAELTGSSISELQRVHAFKDRPFEALVYCLNPDREKLYGWIDKRVDGMMENGFLAEVKGLRDKGYGRDLISMKALGYRELMAHLDGETILEEAVRLIKRNTRRYAKRQLTWFRGERDVRWLEFRELEEIPALAEQIAKEVKGKCRGKRRDW
jgi:tRNA dimethylallyltransferase